MPIYKYVCENCGHAFTKLQKMSDGYPHARCCNNVTLRRVIGGTNFALAGSGWFSDGYQSQSTAQKESGDT